MYNKLKTIITNDTVVWCSFVGILIGFIVGLVLGYWKIDGTIISNLDILSKLAEIITALSVFIAAWAFIYQIKKDSTDAAIDQLSLFRSEFMPISKEIYQEIKKTLEIETDKNFKFPTPGKIPVLSFEWIFLNKTDIFDSQVKPLLNNEQLEEKVKHAVNMLEVFSRNLIHKNIIDHPALIPVKPVYVRFIELNAASICASMYQDKDVYLGINEVYECWKNDVDRDDLVDKIAKTKAKINKNLIK